MVRRCTIDHRLGAFAIGIKHYFGSFVDRPSAILLVELDRLPHLGLAAPRESPHRLVAAVLQLSAVPRWLLAVAGRPESLASPRTRPESTPSLPLLLATSSPLYIAAGICREERTGRASSNRPGPSEAAGKQDATRPKARSKARTVDGAAAHRRARIKVQGRVSSSGSGEDESDGRSKCGDRCGQTPVGGRAG